MHGVTMKFGWMKFFTECGLGARDNSNGHQDLRTSRPQIFFLASSEANLLLTTLNRKYIGYCYRCADKSLAPPGKKQVKVTEDFDFHIPYL